MEMLNLTRSRFQVQEKRQVVGRWEQITQDSVHSVLKMVMITCEVLDAPSRTQPKLYEVTGLHLCS
jgi:hypothetical protein